MFGIKYKTWKFVCKMYFSLNSNSKKSYLQWYPLSKITFEDKKYISSENFFNKYIQKGGFVLFPEIMNQSENFLQKDDGSFRDSSLLSPLLYLIIQAIGKEISLHYHPIRNNNIKTFYAGNYNYSRAKYNQDYNDFYKLINTYIPYYQYFIKTDISNFFSNINIDLLINMIDKRCNMKTTQFSPIQLKMIKELLLYCGSGKFPTLENSVASSYLATIIYKDEIDNKIYQFITKKLKCIESFKIIQYVDDMYILINPINNSVKLNTIYNQIRNEYSSILKEYGLSLNTKKCCLNPSIKICDELKKSLYDEYFNGIKHNIEELFEGKFQDFLNSLLQTLKTNCIDVEQYNALINTYFNNDNIEFTPTEVFNHIIYENKTLLQDDTIICTICDLINTDISFISLDPKRLSIMIIKTKSKKAIKALLNQLFQRSRAQLWNSYDTTIAISYLIQNNFKHTELIKILTENNPNIKFYYNSYCNSHFISALKNNEINTYLQIINEDWKTFFLYFMYLSEKKRNNILVEYAFFKNYFDRITANLDFFFKNNDNSKKPNYKGFYKKNRIKEFYKEIADSDKIIEKAHKLRNSNPLSHSSANSINNSTTSKDFKLCINELKLLINNYIKITYHNFNI